MVVVLFGDPLLPLEVRHHFPLFCFILDAVLLVKLPYIVSHLLPVVLLLLNRVISLRLPLLVDLLQSHHILVPLLGLCVICPLVLLHLPLQQGGIFLSFIIADLLLVLELLSEHVSHSLLVILLLLLCIYLLKLVKFCIVL